MSSKLEQVSTQDAPAAIGPYSQAIRAGDYLFLSGQIALDPASGRLVGKDVQEQTAQVMKNLTGVLKSQGRDLSALVKTTVFLKDMADFPLFNEIYAGFLKAPYPARATIEVSRLPKDAVVEIEAVAYVPRNA